MLDATITVREGQSAKPKVQRKRSEDRDLRSFAALTLRFGLCALHPLDESLPQGATYCLRHAVDLQLPVDRANVRTHRIETHAELIAHLLV